ncbi:MAG: methyltransferase domain-containing protein [Nanoarchaeota archaeon]
MRFDQFWYTLLPLNAHYQNLSLELSRLQKFAENTDIKRDQAIDVGCGNGTITLKLKDHLKINEIHGLEMNAALAKISKEKGIPVIEADMETYRGGKKFDLVISYGSLHHAKHTVPFITNLAQMSKKHILIVDSTVRRNFFHRITGSKYSPIESSPYPVRSVEEIKKAIQSVGLILQKTNTFFNANIWHDRSFFLVQKPSSWRA